MLGEGDASPAAPGSSEHWPVDLSAGSFSTLTLPRRPQTPLTSTRTPVNQLINSTLFMRLAALAPTLPAELAALVPLLAQLEPPILTSRSLLFTPAHTLFQGLTRLQIAQSDMTVPRESALKLLQQAVRRVEAPPMTLGTTGYDDELAGRRRRPGLTTGIVELDRLLPNVSGVIELSGPEGSGKTVGAFDHKAAAARL